MRRAALEKNRTKREWRWHWLSHVAGNNQGNGYRVGVSAYVVDCPCDNQKGRYRKIKGRGCPRCKSGRGCKTRDRHENKASRRSVARKAIREQLEEGNNGR